MRESSVIYPYYLDAWRGVLVGWLGWPEDRIATWVNTWEDRITRNLHGYGDWFYHEDELHYVLPLLVVDELADRLQKQRSGQMHNDLAHLLYEELWPAITQQTRIPSWEAKKFDWQSAKERVGAVLQKYRAKLPEPEDVTSYERRIIGHSGA